MSDEQIPLTVGLAGEGRMLDAMIRLFAKTKTPVRLWQPDGWTKLKTRRRIVKRVPLEGLSDAPLIFVSARHEHQEMIARSVGDVIDGSKAIVHLCRHIDGAELRTFSGTLRALTPTHKFGFLTGPMRVKDIEADHPTAAVCASPFPEVQELVEGALTSPLFRVYRTTDLLGAELAAVYARVITLALGTATGMGLGSSIRATLYVRGLAEMSRFIEAHGGKRATAFGMSGAANLFVDLAEADSVEFCIGHSVVKTKAFSREDSIKEHGLPARDLFALLDLLSEADPRDEYNILTAAHRLSNGTLSAKEALGYLMTLPPLDDA